MKTDIWMPIYIGDYLKDTRHLNTEEHGAYFLILIELWNKQGKIEKLKLPRISLKTNEYFYEKIWPQIEEFFTENEGVIKQKRITKELKASMKRRKAAKDNGKKGGRPKNLKETHRLNSANPRETSSSSPSPSPTSSLKKKILVSPLEDFTPSINLSKWFDKEWYWKKNSQDLIESCFDHFKGKGEKKADWEATIRNWCKKDKEWHPEKYIKAPELEILNP